MSTCILGTGWVTPLGREVDAVVAAVQRGDKGTSTYLKEGSSWPAWRIPPALVADAAAMPRMRRSSVISHFAVAAAKDAIAAAGLEESALAHCALVFAASDGGVIYTRRFFEDVVKNGPGAGSPLLFPETVYNAPASHVAAALGLSGELLTIVGDAAAGLAAIHMACELLADPALEYCLVVAAQECDWASAEAYGRWGLIAGESAPEATPFAEGAAAILLGHSSGAGSEITFSHPGLSYSTNGEATRGLNTILAAIPDGQIPDVIVSSASGSSFDRIEREVLDTAFPGLERHDPKTSLGEALAVSAVEQVIVADHLLRHRQAGRALVPTVGFNGEISALILTAKKA